MEEKHRRRPRYSGKYPRRFEEKYKEKDPERYAGEVQHIREKGNTPAGTHVPIMVDEILEILAIRPGETGYDATLGYGGHSERMLRALNGQGHLYATDVDPEESEKTVKRLAEKGYGPEIFTLKRMNFSRIDEVAPGKAFDFMLADLGVSSMQIDNPERGFTFREDGPLDLRMDQTSGETAAERLSELSAEEFAGMLRENADEPFAEEIAAAVKKHLKKNGPIETTRKLYTVIGEALKGVGVPEKEWKETVRKSATRTFQALRIDVNGEYEALYELLEKIPGVMNPGGRICILTFHSGEDRLVKRAFKEGLKAGIYREVSPEAIRPGKEECFSNPRARSTKLRWAIKA